VEEKESVNDCKRVVITIFLTLVALAIIVRSVVRVVEAAITRSAQRAVTYTAMVTAGLVINIKDSVSEMFAPAETPQYVPKKKAEWTRGLGRLLHRINEGADAVARAIQQWIRPKKRRYTRRYEKIRSFARGEQGHRRSRNRWIVWWPYAIWTLFGRNPYPGRAKGLAGALAMATIVIMEHQDQREQSAMRTRFDTDSARIGIDNRCTACISDKSKYFVGELRTVARAIKGFGGTHTPEVKMGTIKWKWLDDEGVEHTFLIPDSFYIPSGKVNLLSPQHWAQMAKVGKAWESTDAKTCTLHWNGGRHQLTVPLGKSDNVATIDLAPGYSKYSAFCAHPMVSDCFDDDDPVEAMEAATDDLNRRRRRARGRRLQRKFACPGEGRRRRRE
jgi:hypothetical protein